MLEGSIDLIKPPTQQQNTVETIVDIDTDHASESSEQTSTESSSLFSSSRLNSTSTQQQHQNSHQSPSDDQTSTGEINSSYSGSSSPIKSDETSPIEQNQRAKFYKKNHNYLNYFNRLRLAKRTKLAAATSSLFHNTSNNLHLTSQHHRNYLKLKKRFGVNKKSSSAISSDLVKQVDEEDEYESKIKSASLILPVDNNTNKSAVSPTIKKFNSSSLSLSPSSSSHSSVIDSSSSIKKRIEGMDLNRSSSSSKVNKPAITTATTGSAATDLGTTTSSNNTDAVDNKPPVKLHKFYHSVPFKCPFCFTFKEAPHEFISHLTTAHFGSVKQLYEQKSTNLLSDMFGSAMNHHQVEEENVSSSVEDCDEDSDENLDEDEDEMESDDNQTLVDNKNIKNSEDSGNEIEMDEQNHEGSSEEKKSLSSQSEARQHQRVTKRDQQEIHTPPKTPPQLASESTTSAHNHHRHVDANEFNSNTTTSRKSEGAVNESNNELQQSTINNNKSMLPPRKQARLLNHEINKSLSDENNNMGDNESKTKANMTTFPSPFSLSSGLLGSPMHPSSTSPSSSSSSSSAANIALGAGSQRSSLSASEASMKCAICDRGFEYYSNLRRHIKTKHKIFGKQVKDFVVRQPLNTQQQQQSSSSNYSSFHHNHNQDLVNTMDMDKASSSGNSDQMGIMRPPMPHSSSSASSFYGNINYMVDMVCKKQKQLSKGGSGNNSYFNFVNNSRKPTMLTGCNKANNQEQSSSQSSSYSSIMDENDTDEQQRHALNSDNHNGNNNDLNNEDDLDEENEEDELNVAMNNNNNNKNDEELDLSHTSSSHNSSPSLSSVSSSSHYNSLTRKNEQPGNSTRGTSSGGSHPLTNLIATSMAHNGSSMYHTASMSSSSTSNNKFFSTGHNLAHHHGPLVSSPPPPSTTSSTGQIQASHSQSPLASSSSSSPSAQMSAAAALAAYAALAPAVQSPVNNSNSSNNNLYNHQQQQQMLSFLTQNAAASQTIMTSTSSSKLKSSLLETILARKMMPAGGIGSPNTNRESSTTELNDHSESANNLQAAKMNHLTKLLQNLAEMNNTNGSGANGSPANNNNSSLVAAVTAAAVAAAVAAAKNMKPAGEYGHHSGGEISEQDQEDYKENEDELCMKDDENENGEEDVLDDDEVELKHHQSVGHRRHNYHDIRSFQQRRDDELLDKQHNMKHDQQFNPQSMLPFHHSQYPFQSQAAAASFHSSFGNATGATSSTNKFLFNGSSSSPSSSSSLSTSSSPPNPSAVSSSSPHCLNPAAAAFNQLMFENHLRQLTQQNINFQSTYQNYTSLMQGGSQSSSFGSSTNSLITSPINATPSTTSNKKNFANKRKKSKDLLTSRDSFSASRNMQCSPTELDSNTSNNNRAHSPALSTASSSNNNNTNGANAANGANGGNQIRFSTEIWRCPYCCYETTSASRYNSHLVCHGFKPYLCPYCGSRSNRLPDMRTHISTFHPENNVNTFVVLSDEEAKSTLKDYMKNRALINRKLKEMRPQPKFKCKLCQYASLYQFNLTKHVKSVHINEIYHANNNSSSDGGNATSAKAAAAAAIDNNSNDS